MKRDKKCENATGRTLDLSLVENTLISAKTDRYVMNRVGMQLEKGLKLADWISLVRSLKQVATSIQLIVGDAINYGEHEYGSKYREALLVLCDDEADADTWYGNLANWASVCKSVSFSLRSEIPLYYSHYREVAPLEPKEQRKWLLLAKKNDWPVTELRQAMRRAAASVSYDGSKWSGGFQVFSWVKDGLRWFTQELPDIQKDPERRALLKKDLAPLVEIYNRL